MIYIDILTDMLIISDDTNYMGRATKTIAYLLFVPLTYIYPKSTPDPTPDPSTGKNSGHPVTH